MAKRLTTKQKALMKNLTPLQKKFAIHMCETGDRVKSYKLAGGKAKTQAAQAAGASELLYKPQVKAFYDALIERAADEAVMSKSEALARLSRSAKVTITDICDFEQIEVGVKSNGTKIFQTVWTIKNSEDIPEHVAACIKSVSKTTTGMKLELHDSHGAIKQLAEMLGWNEAQKHDVQITDITRTIIDPKSNNT
jgi:phage terminase small subunit